MGIRIAGIAVLAVGVVVVLLLVLAGNRERTVGKHIAPEEITEFFYTEASSAYPPGYQRYRFYTEAGKTFFYHETREGLHWPLTEEDISCSGSVQLSEEAWARFMDCLRGGSVRKRGENAESGGSAPALYLYWKGDRAKYQEFSFASPDKLRAFEALCAELAGRSESAE